MEVVFRSMRLMLLCSSFLKFMIEYSQTTQRGLKPKEGSWGFFMGRWGEGQHLRSSGICLILSPFPHPYPKLGLPGNIQDIHLSKYYAPNNEWNIFRLNIIYWLSRIKTQLIGIFYFSLIKLAIISPAD